MGQSPNLSGTNKAACLDVSLASINVWGRGGVLFFLRHAGVYTAEEVALITREKLIRLQSLYIDQFKRLQHLLKEKKRRYLHNRKMEHESIGRSGPDLYPCLSSSVS